MKKMKKRIQRKAMMTMIDELNHQTNYNLVRGYCHVCYRKEDHMRWSNAKEIIIEIRSSINATISSSAAYRWLEKEQL